GAGPAGGGRGGGRLGGPPGSAVLLRLGCERLVSAPAAGRGGLTQPAVRLPRRRRVSRCGTAEHRVAGRNLSRPAPPPCLTPGPGAFHPRRRAPPPPRH